jgi:hypothetical protein
MLPEVSPETFIVGGFVFASIGLIYIIYKNSKIYSLTSGEAQLISEKLEHLPIKEMPKEDFLLYIKALREQVAVKRANEALNKPSTDEAVDQLDKSNKIEI